MSVSVSESFVFLDTGYRVSTETFGNGQLLCPGVDTMGAW
jgi:hypothetical protein